MAEREVPRAVSTVEVMEREAGEQAPTLKQVTEQTRYLLGNFIEGRMLRDGLTKLPGLNYLIGEGPFQLPSSHLKETIRCVKRVADEIDQDHRLQEAINSVPPDAEKQTFFAVAKELSKDGRWSWGRVIALFCFGYGLCKKSMDRFPLMQAIVSLIVDYIHDHAAQWIVASGGWVAIRYYVDDLTRSQVAVVVVGAVVVGIGAAAATAVAIIYYFRSR